ncbi:MAG: tetratricopeptide repeat protein, partial [Gemmataceae bacterium]|nr:tetratricopeptide repeat protein [Gemmataceae bacterium]
MDQQPMTLDAALEQAQNLMRAGQMVDALNLYDQIIAAVPQIADPYGAKSLALWEMERYDEAAATAHTALGINENCATAFCTLGLVEHKRNLPAAAIPHLRRAYEIKPDLVA